MRPCAAGFISCRSIRIARQFRGLLRRWLTDNKPDMLWVADVVDRANEELGSNHMAIGPSHFLRSDLTEEWVELIWEHSVPALHRGAVFRR